jgi:hypothetical protein
MTERLFQVAFRDMPSRRHDSLNQLFRDHPALAVELLRELGGVDLPSGMQVQVADSTFNDRPSADFPADSVITVGPPHNPIHGIIVEIEQARREEKRRQLPRYAAALWLHLRHRVDVLLVCPDAKVADFYTEPIVTELPGYRFQAVVMGPGDIPAISDPLEAAIRPEMAVMAVMAHGRDRKVAETFISALEHLESEHAVQYYEHAIAMAAPAVRRVLEEIMSSTDWPVHSSFAKLHFGRGKTEGRTEGLAEGRIEEAANLVLMVLSTRGLTVSDSARTRITTCTDIGQLEAWAKSAVTTDSTDGLFG